MGGAVGVAALGSFAVACDGEGGPAGAPASGAAARKPGSPLSTAMTTPGVDAELKNFVGKIERAFFFTFV